MIFTIDPYYPVTFYNECLEALKNNNINYNELINIKSPYNWYIKTEKEPIMVNYDEISKNDKRFLVTKIVSVRDNEQYFTQRRDDSSSPGGILRYIENEPFKDARNSNTSLFFKGTRDNLIKISKEFPGKIWYLGKYYNNTIRVFLCNNDIIKNYINKNDILLEKGTEHKLPGYFEADFNWKILKNKEYIIKHFETLYIQNGQVYYPKYYTDTTKTIIN